MVLTTDYESKEDTILWFDSLDCTTREEDIAKEE